MKTLRGTAADAAYRLLPPVAQRTVTLMAELMEVPVRRAVRALVHDYEGNVEEFRSAVIYGVVKEARAKKARANISDAEVAEQVVGEILISEDRRFPEYLEVVHLALTGKERVL